MRTAARALAALGAVALVGLLAVAGPALSAQHYRPAPVEFDMTAPETGLGGPTKRGFVSRELQAPKRFNLVGFVWEGEAEPAIAVRVRGEGDPWGPWTPVPAHSDGAPDPAASEEGVPGGSEPVWAGEADSLQYRMSRRPPDLRLHFINTTGTATALDRLQTDLREAANDGVMAVARLTSAGAATERPDMISRGGWGADACEPRVRPEYGRVKLAFVHHTVSANRYSRSEAKSMVLGICLYHRNTNGWDDIGYNFLVDRFGRIFVGRAGGVGKPVQGAHAEGFNTSSTGVASLGTHDSQRMSRAGVRGLARVIGWKLSHHGKPVSGTTRVISGGGDANRYPAGTEVRLKRVSGHRDVNYTECPGSKLYRQLRNVRRKAIEG